MKVVIRQSDFKRLVDCPYDLRDRCLFRLLYVLGLRSTELCSIKVSDVDVDSQTVTIIDSKKKKPFTLPLDAKTTDLLRQYVKDKTGWLFPTRSKSGHLTKEGLNCCIKSYAKWIGLNPKKFYARMFRRHLARLWVVKKGSLTALQDLLRHERFSSTAIYVDGIKFHDELKSEFSKIIGE